MPKKLLQKSARNATTKPLKTHYKVPMERQINYCKT